MNTSAVGINRIDVSSSRLFSAVGFLNGCVELMPKKPLPLVFSCLMAIWLVVVPLAGFVRCPVGWWPICNR